MPAEAPPRMDLPDIPSPCVAVCQLDPVTPHVQGCLRTPREIARWPYADNAEKCDRAGIARTPPGARDHQRRRQPAAPPRRDRGLRP